MTENINYPALTIMSSAFRAGGTIPVQFTCDGADKHPPLEISDIPAGAITLALIVNDPDAAAAGGWVHWLKWNIPAHTETTVVIREGEEPMGVSGESSDATRMYHGPCPPFGTHRYFFKAYALDSELALPAGAGKDELITAMSGHIRAYGELMGTYTRK